jgi:hypothetical protein
MEIVQWFEGWKALFPADYIDNPMIQSHFKMALDMMNTHLEEGAILLPQTITQKLERLDLEKGSEKQPASSLKGFLSSNGLSAPLQLTLKDAVQHVAESHGISFIPLGKSHDGNPIYKFGTCSIYLDKRVIRVQDAQHKDVWLPVSLDQLIDQAQ